MFLLVTAYTGSPGPKAVKQWSSHREVRAPNPSLAGSWELPKSEEKNGGGVGVPDHLGQTS